MGFLLDDILMAPCKLVCWIGGTLQKQALEELTDPSTIQQQLLDIQVRVELEQISEDEYLRAEQALLDRLEAIRKYKESQPG